MSTLTAAPMSTQSRLDRRTSTPAQHDGLDAGADLDGRSRGVRRVDDQVLDYEK